MTETEFLLKYEDLNDRLYRVWGKGETLVFVLIDLKKLIEKYIDEYDFNITKKLNGSD